MRELTGWSRDLRVTADGDGVVGMVGLVGLVGLRMLADRAGLTAGLSRALAKPGILPVHDRGRVLTDVACSGDSCGRWACRPADHAGPRAVARGRRQPRRARGLPSPPPPGLVELCVTGRHMAGTVLRLHEWPLESARHARAPLSMTVSRLSITVSRPGIAAHAAGRVPAKPHRSERCPYPARALAHGQALRGHHTNEDRVLAHLEQQFSHLAPVVRRLREDHELLAARLGRLEKLLESDREIDLEAELDRLEADLGIHFAYEEKYLTDALNRLA